MNRSIGEIATVAFVIALIASASTASAAPIQWNSGSGSNGHWYEVIAAPDGVTWDAAQADAVSRGGYLATVLSSEENAFVFSLVDAAEYWTTESLGSSANLGPWLGGYQESGSSEPSGGWTWVNGDGPFVFTNWHSSEPNDGVGSPHGLHESRLAYFEYGGRSSSWNDLPETYDINIAYVVEYSRNPIRQSVPEPGTAFLLALALGGYCARNRARRVTTTSRAMPCNSNRASVFQPRLGDLWRRLELV